jgi:RNA polymerase sigma-70 factor (ECF subfamily)
MSSNSAYGTRLRLIEGRGAPEAPEPSDSELIDAFERGDGEACDRLYSRLVGTVEATLFRVLGQRDDHHEDLVQSAFEQIVFTLSTRRFARACSLASWASSVTTHIAFNTIRRRVRERKVVDRGRDAEVEGQRAPSTVDVERDVVVEQSWKGVRRHLAEMSEAQANTLILHDVLGHDLAEIAVLTGVSVSAAQSRLIRGRNELKARVARDARTEGGRP